MSRNNYLSSEQIIDSIYSSAIIEGIRTDKEAVKGALSGEDVYLCYTDIAFISNMQEAWRFLLSSCGRSNNISYARNLHEIVGKWIIRDCGNLRSMSVHITGVSYIPPIPNISEVSSNLSYIDKITDPVTKALSMFCYFARTQMFSDGNKRMAQLMANKVLMQGKAGILIIPPREREVFFSHLVDYYETNKASGLCSFLSRECIQKV